MCCKLQAVKQSESSFCAACLAFTPLLRKTGASSAEYARSDARLAGLPSVRVCEAGKHAVCAEQHETYALVEAAKLIFC